MATSTPVNLGGGGATGDIRAFGASGTQVRMIVSFNPGTYATGGVAVTLPSADVKAKQLVAVNLLKRIPAVGTDRIYDWNGSVSAPLLVAKVISTAAEVANATDLSGDTLVAELIFN